MMQNYSVAVHEEEIPEIKPRETRMQCLFRHVRNSFAHNQTYLFNNGKILLEDRNEDDSNITAKILIPKEALLKWMEIIKEGDKKNGN